MPYYPIFIDMGGRRIVVIGGGHVATEKVTGLMNAEADLTLIAPELAPNLQELVDAGKLKHIAREYQDGDIAGFELVFVATDDGAVNATVAAEGKQRGIWVNAADDPRNCDFILPSVVRQGQVVVAASTGGASPALARRLREDLTAFLAEDYAPLADLLQEVRQAIRQRHIHVEFAKWQTALDARVRALVAQGRIDEARERLVEGLGVTEQLAATAAES